MEKTISNWGNYPKQRVNEWNPSSERTLLEAINKSGNIIARGLGRSYGDASLGKTVLSTVHLNRILEFNSGSGVLIAECGVSLEQIIEEILPKGWFLPVTPGTKYVTMGGAIAADIHGKNHHVEGCFSRYIQWFDIIIESGETLRCSDSENTDLFHATFGGMGLTGVVIRAALRCKKVETSYIYQTIQPCYDLKELLEKIDQSISSTYSVAWIDCFTKNGVGKGILITGEHATTSQLPANNQKLSVDHPQKRSVPFFFPSWALSKLSIKVFNQLYFRKQRRNSGTSVVNYNAFFYPLDAIKNWNRIYGRNGFIQYQMVIPTEYAHEGLTRLLSVIKEKGYGSFLSVLKLFGAENKLLSFPSSGYTLALDFPAKKEVFDLVHELDEIVCSYGGRIYLAKDATTTAVDFKKMYSDQTVQFTAIRKTHNPTGKFRSSQSDRVQLTTDEKLSEPSMNQPKSILVLGATSDIARAIAKEYGKQGYQLYLAARTPAAITKSEWPADSSVQEFNALDFGSHADFVHNLGIVPDIALIAFGYLGDQKEAEVNFDEAKLILDTNFTGAVSICEALADAMKNVGKGSIIGISSVAGDRGKKSNYMYGAAKSGFTEFLSGLRHRLHGSGVHVLTVKPGFVKTRMTEGMDLPPRLTASVEQVAKAVVKAERKHKNVLYVKAIWRPIMFIIRCLPHSIFKKSDL